MKLEDIDEFKPPPNMMYSCMEYVKSDADGNDVLYAGTLCGQVHSFNLSRRKFPRSMKPDDLCPTDVQHGGAITCIIYSDNSELSASRCGIVISGSVDRTVKIWSPIVNRPQCIQTLYGHEGTVTRVADAHDGTLLSCSIDGCLRLWRPQRGRAIMLHNFLECTFVMKQKDTWLSSLAVSHINSWMCYVGTMDGTVEIYRKGSEHNEAEHRTAVFTGQLTKHKRWEHVHALGVSMLHIVFEEGFLITLSFDHTCKILDQHLGTCLHVIQSSHGCKFTGLVWDARNFQVFLTDELGHLEVWSTFYERRVEDIAMVHWKPPRRETTSSIHGSSATMTIAQLVALPLIGSIQPYKATDCLLSLNRRTGVIQLWQTTAEQATAEFVGHNGQMVLGMAVLETPPEGRKDDPDSCVAEGAAEVRETNLDGTGRKNFQVLKLQSRQRAEKKNQLSVISPEESTFFSVGEDNSLCCWDEYDRSERFSFRLKESGDVVMVRVVWSLHSVATGHEDGVLCLWNMDSGTKVASRALRGAPVTAIAEGKNKHSDDVLLAADRDGRLAVWNLSLFKMQCLDLPLELLTTGFHDPEDPGILSLTFHKKSACFLSGGTDGIISCWRLQVDHDPMRLRYHAGNSVWNLSASEKFMLSGDESGRVVLWSMRRVRQNLFGNSGVFPLQVTILCCWHGAMQGSFQSFCLQQTAQGAAYVAMADVGGLSSSVWRVNIAEVTPAAFNQPDRVQSPSKSAGRRRRISASSGKPSDGSVAASTSSMASGSVHNAFEPAGSTSTTPTTSTSGIIMNKYDGSDSMRDESTARFVYNGSGLPPFVSLVPTLALSADATPKDLARQVEVFPIPPSSSEQPGVELANMVLHEEDYEPSCMELRFLGSGGGKALGNKKKGCVLYIGMANGSIQKHSLGNE